MFVLCRHEFPTEAAELDKLFKESGCTLTAAGYQDGMVGDLILTLAANANNLRYHYCGASSEKCNAFLPWLY